MTVIFQKRRGEDSEKMNYLISIIQEQEETSPRGQCSQHKLWDRRFVPFLHSCLKQLYASLVREYWEKKIRRKDYWALLPFCRINGSHNASPKSRNEQ